MQGWTVDKPKAGYMLDLGAGDPEAGEVQADGYYLQDIQPYKNIHLVCDIRELDSYVDKKSVKRLRMSHVLEHFTRGEVPRVLAMLKGLLMDDGELEIIVPNLEWHARLIISGLHTDAERYIFGGQLDEWDIHKTGFTSSTLFKILEQSGYKVRSIQPFTSITAVASPA